MAEIIKGNPRELNFYGEGKAESIKRGFAITSLRNPKPDYEFTAGEVINANCQDDGEKESVIVLSNNKRKLSEHSVPVLALDGFFSAEHAVEGMKIYPGYKKIDSETEISAITFVSLEAFNELHPMMQHIALTKPLETSMTFHGLRHLFFPTMAFWLAENYGTLMDWVEFLAVCKLINENEIAEMSQYKFMGSETGRRLFNENSKMLQELSINPRHEAFRPLILGLETNNL